VGANNPELAKCPTQFPAAKAPLFLKSLFGLRFFLISARGAAVATLVAETL
jgi:hypothetical protein